MTHIIDDKLLNDLVTLCVARAEEIGIKFVAISTSDAPPVEGVPQKHYSSVGNFPLANTSLLPMHIDYSNDLYEIMGHELAIPQLEHHSQALQNYMWQELDKVRERAS